MNTVRRDSSGALEWAFVFALFLLYAAFLFGVLAYKYLNVGWIIDLNHFSEAFATAARGEVFHNHSHYWEQIDKAGLELDPLQTASLFGVHFRPFFYIMLPFYKLVPSVYTLFLFQSVVVASAVFPLFLLCRERSVTVGLTLLSLLVFVCYPLSTAASTGFFPSYMAIPMLLWAIYFIEKNRMLSLCLVSILILSLKEILAAPVFVCGIYCLIKRSKLVGAVICIASAAYLLICLEYIIPMFSITSEYTFYNFYGAPGDSGIIQALKSGLHPARILEAVFRVRVWEYLGNMFIPLLGLPLIAPVSLLAFPVLAQNILAIRADYALFITGHLSAPILPFLFYGFVVAVAKLRKILSNRVIGTILTISLVLSCGFSVSILSGWIYKDDVLRKAVATVKPHMTPGDIVAFGGVTNLHPYFSDKFTITHFQHYPEANWNILHYNADVCSQEYDKYSEEDLKKSPITKVSLDSCKMLQDSCYTVYFNEPHAPNPFMLEQEDIRLLIVENTCVTREAEK